MKVSINDGSDWKTFSVLVMKLVGGRSFPLKEKTDISQDAMGSDFSCSLAFWLRLLTKKSYFGSCLTFLAELCMRVGSRRVVL